LSASKYSFDKESTPKPEKKAEEKPTKKRAASEDETGDSKKKVKDSQKATGKALNIPIDEGFDQRGGDYKSKLTKASRLPLATL
jgi:poly [ADP-ribose] polymerase